LIIFAGIIAGFPSMIGNAITGILNQATDQWLVGFLWMAAAVVGIIVLIAVIVFVDEGERRIPVQYAKRMVGRRMYGGNASHIPMKVNASGVMPLIFAMSILQFPSIILSFGNLQTSRFAMWWNQWMSPAAPLYMGLFALMIVFFAFFYSTIQFNPIEVAKNIQQNGGFIMGIRPGKPTSDFLKRSVNRMTLTGSLFLAVVATIPSVIMVISGNNSPFTATGILIVVSVALETAKQIEAQMLMRHYKGFMG
jgi:preprotein translocase subunit SecY